MIKAARHLPLLVLLTACAYASDFESSLDPENIAFQQITPAPEAPAALRADADYCDYYAALSYYSEAAYKAEQGTDAYLEAYIAGSYLRGKVDALDPGPRAAGEPALCSREGAGHEPSKRVIAELRKAFAT